ncbi:capsular polysaccharide synthesis protein, partial [Candidatus Termititenax persephonae]
AYFLIDYCVALAYENVPALQDMLDAVPPSNPQIYALAQVLNDAYDAELFRQISADTCFHKLNWKMDFAKRTKNGEQTFYGKIVA